MSVNVDEFRSDLAALTAKILMKHPLDPNSRLGDILQNMSENNMLLLKKRDEIFDIKDTNKLSEETRVYLNLLQTEKLNHCRQCYNKTDAQEVRCWFHKKYIFDKCQTKFYHEYVDFLNSEMGIISFVELYYVYLALDDVWKHNAPILLDKLTGFKSIKSLLSHYNYECEEAADTSNVECMDTD